MQIVHLPPVTFRFPDECSPEEIAHFKKVWWAAQEDPQAVICINYGVELASGPTEFHPPLICFPGAPDEELAALNEQITPARAYPEVTVNVFSQLYALGSAAWAQRFNVSTVEGLWHQR